MENERYRKGIARFSLSKCRKTKAHENGASRKSNVMLQFSWAFPAEFK